MRDAAQRDRSKAAFEELYGRVAERLLVYIARRMHDPDAVAEVWSECWAVGFEGWVRCTAVGPAATEAWVFGIARHRLADYYRSGAIEHRALTRLGWSVPVFDHAAGDELKRVTDLDSLKTIVNDALSDLSAKRRHAVRLRIVDGLSPRDVAARMNCTEQTARAHVSRGLRRLAKAIDHAERLQLEKRAP